MAVLSLLPVFCVAALGALLARLRWPGGPCPDGLNALAARVLLPALLFHGSYRTGIPASVSWQVLVAFYVPLAGVWAATRLLAGRGGNAAALAASYSNTVFVGLPVLVQVLGKDSLQYAFPVIAFHSLLCFTLYHLTDTSHGPGWKRAILNALSSPIVVALLSGLALNLAGMRLPTLLSDALAIVSAAALPCALLALGASLASLRPARWGGTCAIALAKLVVLPLAVLLSALLLRLPESATTVLVVLAACPVGMNAAFVATPGSSGARLVHSAILVSTLACAATIPIWVAVLHAIA